MTQTEIKRTAAIDISEMVPMLADEAREVLGYSRDEEDAPQISEVRKALAECEIEILDWRDVARYQMQERHRVELARLEDELRRDERNRWPVSVSWTGTKIEKYRGFIPDHVLLKAIQLKKRLPEAEMYVEHLEETKDPFLYVKEPGKNSWDDKKLYFEVWGEEAFEHPEVTEKGSPQKRR